MKITIDGFDFYAGGIWQAIRLLDNKGITTRIENFHFTPMYRCEFVENSYFAKKTGLNEKQITKRVKYSDKTPFSAFVGCIAKAKALDRSDLNKDGTVDMLDFAMFAEDYSLFPNTRKMVKPAEKRIIYQDANTVVYQYGTLPELNNYGDMNDLSFVNYYYNEYLNNYQGGAEK